jgi:predicted permease
LEVFFKAIIEVLGVTFPVFAVIAIGFIIKKRNLLKEEHVPVLNSLTYNFGLPALVFSGIVKNSFSEIFDADIIKVIFPAYFIFIFFIFASFYFSKINSQIKGAAIVSSFRNNMAFIGLPILLYAYGSLAAARASVVLALLLPLNIILTALFFQLQGSAEKSFKIKNLLKEIFLDPVIIAVIVGLIISYFSVPMPTPAGRLLEILSNIAVPLALLSIGASFKFAYIKNNIKYITIICIAKLVLFPLLTLVFSIFVFKASELNRDIICVLFATPVAVATYIQSRKYNTDSDFVSAVIIISTIASALTLSGWLFILKLL